MHLGMGVCGSPSEGHGVAMVAGFKKSKPGAPAWERGCELVVKVEDISTVLQGSAEVAARVVAGEEFTAYEDAVAEFDAIHAKLVTVKDKNESGRNTKKGRLGFKNLCS